jgi:hypothetical protein
MHGKIGNFAEKLPGPEKAVSPLLFFLLIQFVIAQLCFQKAIKNKKGGQEAGRGESMKLISDI